MRNNYRQLRTLINVYVNIYEYLEILTNFPIVSHEGLLVYDIVAGWVWWWVGGCVCVCVICAYNL